MRKMTKNSTRTYWMTNEKWYQMVDGEFQLTPDAPEQARKSFAEWKRPYRSTFKTKLKYIKTKIIVALKIPT